MDTWIGDELTFPYDEGHGGILSSKIVEVTTGFNGDIAFDLRNRLPHHVGIAEALCTASPAGPTIGTGVVSGNRQTVKFPITGFAAVDYILTVVITDTNTPVAGIFTVKGKVNVE